MAKQRDGWLRRGYELLSIRTVLWRERWLRREMEFVSRHPTKIINSRHKQRNGQRALALKKYRLRKIIPPQRFDGVVSGRAHIGLSMGVSGPLYPSFPHSTGRSGSFRARLSLIPPHDRSVWEFQDLTISQPSRQVSLGVSGPVYPSFQHIYSGLGVSGPVYPSFPHTTGRSGSFRT